MDPNVAPSSLQSALQMDQNQQHHPQQQQQQQQNQQQQLQQQQQQAPSPPAQSTSRKRKKNDTNGDDAQSPSEPRRLRRSHEACARCRSKKIKCDSKHPRCTACSTAGTPCHQEDRHRQTLTPRGHTERIEHQLAQCDALLKHHIPNFSLDSLDEILLREGIEVGSPNLANAPPGPPAFQFVQQPANRPPGAPFRPDGPPQGSPNNKGAYVFPPPPQHMYPPMPMPYAPGYPHMQMQGPPPGYNPHIHPAFQQMPPPTQPQTQVQPQAQHMPPPPLPPVRPVISHDIKGQDPQSNDMSNTQALAKNFGVHAAIVSDLSLGPNTADKEDLAVGSSGLTSGRDRDYNILGENKTRRPRDVDMWVKVFGRKGFPGGSIPADNSAPHISLTTAPPVEVWLPKDRKMVQHIVGVYFTRLNVHRPVFTRKEFERVLDAAYTGEEIGGESAPEHQLDPGFVCSLYLVLALGTLSELNHRAVQAEGDSDADVGGPISAKQLMPVDWPEHGEFFERALSVKPDLRVTISSLQALVLLHWYLYTERQGRTLWRLVGSLVRLSIELGLHHDPTIQQSTFTDEECQLRIRLWGIVMVHDRGTSILLGRPLGISPSDSNTPRPSRPLKASKSYPSLNEDDFSEHFLLSHPIAEIQADIINSLYTPKRQSGDTIMRNATRIIKSMLEFRKNLPESYKYYFNGTEDWTLERKSTLVQGITADQGLTLLKIGIARILLLRALFSSKELSYAQRLKALVDAIITSHNVIIVHNQLIRFPDIAFFTSPIPLHIAAMVILYGHMSRCDHLPKQVALEDIWLALDMLPRFRWRWERKDVNGGHPLIAKLAERVMDVDLHQIKPSNHLVLLSEPEWDASDESMIMSPPLSSHSQVQTSSKKGKSQQSTPTMASAYPSSNNGVIYGPHPRTANGTSSTGHGMNGSGTPPDQKHLLEVPANLFYPFYPETQFPMSGSHPAAAGNGNNGNGSNPNSNGTGQQQDYTHLLAAAAAQPMSTAQGSQDSFMSEERDINPHHQNSSMQMWMHVPGPRGAPYAVPPQS